MAHKIEDVMRQIFTKSRLLRFAFVLIALFESYLASKIYDANKTFAQGIVAVAFLYAFIRFYLFSENLTKYSIDKMIAMPRFWRWQLFWFLTICWAMQIAFDSIFRLVREFLYSIWS